MKALVAILFAFAVGACLTAAAQPGGTVVDKLRSGGYILYMRHTSTDFSQNDSASRSYGDCSHQRSLTDQGRAEARSVAQHVARLKIPVGRVLASPFCRTMETARLAFGKGQPEPRIRSEAFLTNILSTKIAAGSNLAIASHGNPFRAVAGPPHLAEGEIAVVRPEGDGRFSIVTRIRLEDWPALRAGAGPAS